MVAFKYSANDGYIGVIWDTFWDRSCIITGTHLYTKTSSVPRKINRTYDCRLCFRLWQELILLNSIIVTCLPVASRTLRFIPTERTCCCSLVFPNLQCCRTVNAVNSSRDMPVLSWFRNCASKEPSRRQVSATVKHQGIGPTLSSVVFKPLCGIPLY